MYNVIYLRTCGCTVCWRTTLACFSRAHALSYAFSARSYESTDVPCNFFDGDAKTVKLRVFVVIFAMIYGLQARNMCCCLQSVVIYDVVIPEGFCVAVNGEKFWARNQRRCKRYVVITDVVISEVYCMPICLYVDEYGIFVLRNV